MVLWVASQRARCVRVHDARVGVLPSHWDRNYYTLVTLRGRKRCKAKRTVSCEEHDRKSETANCALQSDERAIHIEMISSRCWDRAIVVVNDVNVALWLFDTVHSVMWART